MMASNNNNDKSNNDDDEENTTTTTTKTTATATKTTTTTKTEREKMISGEFYLAFDDDLLQDRQRAKLLCYKYNQMNPLEIDKRKLILKELLLLDADSQDEDDDIIKSIWIESPFNVDYGRYLKVGTNFYANHGCTILDCNYIKFGNNCLLAPHVCISAATHPINPILRQNGSEFTGPISIGNNVWIGSNATICPNVTLGNNVVVGANAVVTKSFQSNVVIGGVPAKILKYINNNNNDDDSSSEISESDIVRDRRAMMMISPPPNQEEEEEEEIVDELELEQLEQGITDSLSC